MHVCEAVIAQHSSCFCTEKYIVMLIPGIFYLLYTLQNREHCATRKCSTIFNGLVNQIFWLIYITNIHKIYNKIYLVW